MPSAAEGNEVAKALLRATRVSHVVVGAFSMRRLAIVRADVASQRSTDPEARGRVASEALHTICRTFGLYATRCTALGDEVHLMADGNADAGIAWLSSERCLIGIWRMGCDATPFVALIRDGDGRPFHHWQRDVSRVALLGEGGRLAASPSLPPLDTVVDEIMRQLSVGCALVDARRNVIYANEAARRWLGEQDGLRLAGARLAATAAESQRGLCSAIRSATIGDPRRPQSVVIKGERSGGLPRVVTCLPLPAAEERALLVFGTRSGSAELADVLLGAFGLTGAERRLACHLLLGRTLEEAAEEVSIRISTARSYLKAIFAKTGVRRQSEFVAVVGALVPPIMTRAPA